ncbi:hypothetical protein [Sporosarcina sp. HYO08]|uniref:hypothetical protein n=1 Tax=Sporosarcina sp. HYO08 TaxID=1759557 RepID=UPI000793FEC2|nr:hypothetical protein [Sporosarcina sp. HYO08]KXH87238.1 hypothetical protein AU377_01305 [Sporosarcina sp. HYO08]
MKRFISKLVVIALVCNIFLPLQAASAIDVPQEEKTAEKVNFPAFQSEGEIKEKRTAYSKVYQQKNGAHKLEISADPIHYKDQKTKKWEEIDNTLKRNKAGRYQNEKNAFGASFSSKMITAEPLVSLQYEGKTVDITSMTKNGEKPANRAAVIEENQVTI